MTNTIDRPRQSAPTSGPRNAYSFLVKSDPTWRESILGSTFLLAVFTVAAGVASVTAVVLRQRRAH
jgi:hypothetical protein